MNSLGDALAEDLDAAFARLVETTQDRLYALTLSLTRRPHEAQDVAQDTFVRAYRALKSYAPQRRRTLNVRPWLAKIALNVWRNRLRSRREVSSLDREPSADVREIPAAIAERSESAIELRSLLKELPERYRLAVVLRHAYDLPYAQAAQTLGIPIGTVKANVHRGTRMLREAFTRHKKVEHR